MPNKLQNSYAAGDNIGRLTNSSETASSKGYLLQKERNKERQNLHQHIEGIKIQNQINNLVEVNIPKGKLLNWC